MRSQKKPKQRSDKQHERLSSHRTVHISVNSLKWLEDDLWCDGRAFDLEHIFVCNEVLSPEMQEVLFDSASDWAEIVETSRTIVNIVRTKQEASVWHNLLNLMTQSHVKSLFYRYFSPPSTFAFKLFKICLFDGENQCRKALFNSHIGPGDGHRSRSRRRRGHYKTTAKGNESNQTHIQFDNCIAPLHLCTVWWTDWVW